VASVFKFNVSKPVVTNAGKAKTLKTSKQTLTP
jgi:hypothetical protein